MLYPRVVKRFTGSIVSLLPVVVCVVVREADSLNAARPQYICVFGPAIEPIVVAIVEFFSLYCLIAENTLKIRYRKIVLPQHLHSVGKEVTIVAVVFFKNMIK